MGGDRGELEVALADAGAGDVRERGVDLLADLVAAAARARPERGVELPLDAELAQGGDALGDDPGRQPAPAAVQRGHPAGAAEHHREAVRDEDERGELGLRGRLAVLLGVPAHRPGGAPHAGAVDLAAVQEAVAREPDRGGEAVAVGVDVRVRRRR